MLFNAGKKSIPTENALSAGIPQSKRIAMPQQKIYRSFNI